MDPDQVSSQRAARRSVVIAPTNGPVGGNAARFKDGGAPGCLGVPVDDSWQTLPRWSSAPITIGVMGLVFTTTAGLVVWVVLWSLGVSGFDAFFFPLVLVLSAVAISNIRPSDSGAGRLPPMPSVNNAARRESGDSPETSSLVKAVWAMGAGLFVVGLGVWCWSVAITKDLSARLSDVGSALLTGAVVAFAVLLLQQRLDAQAERQRQQFEAQAEEARRLFEAGLEAQNLRLVVGLQSDLTKADLSDVDLSRAIFNDKKLAEAVFLRTKLTRAAFLHAILVDANFAGADLTDAVFSFANLERAEFFAADVTNAVFTDAININEDQFNGAYYRDNKPPVFNGPLPDVIKPRP